MGKLKEWPSPMVDAGLRRMVGDFKPDATTDEVWKGKYAPYLIKDLDKLKEPKNRDTDVEFDFEPGKRLSTEEVIQESGGLQPDSESVEVAEAVAPVRGDVRSKVAAVLAKLGEVFGFVS